MLPQHWLLMAVMLVVGLFVQKYMDPLGKIGL